MKNRKDLYLTFRDNKSHVIFEGVWHKIPFKETYIIGKCIELYGDPEPCFIHRSAALSRIFSEMIMLFDKYENDKIHIVDLDDDSVDLIKDYAEHMNIEACRYIEVKFVNGRQA